jgi:hypothetical protein
MGYSTTYSGDLTTAPYDIAAGLMVHQFTRWLRNLPLDSVFAAEACMGDWNCMDLISV